MGIFEYRNRRRFPSTERLLRKFFGRKEWANLERSIFDRRLIFAEASSRLGVREERLMAGLAEMSDLPYAFSVSSIEVGALPNGLMLSELFAAGAFPVISADRFVGVVCIDPQRLYPLLRGVSPLEIRISSWRNISQAFNRIEDGRLLRTIHGDRTFKNDLQGKEVLSNEHLGHVLLVEDDSAFSTVLQKFLLKIGCTVELTPDVQSAKELLSRDRYSFDLVVTDVHLKGQNGSSLVEWVRQTPSVANIPVIALTSDRTVETQLTLLRSGADLYLGKDVDPRVLCEYVRHFLERRLAA